MLNLLTFIIGIIVIFCLARYNKSNKLFWLLLISMLSGFVGGTIAANMKNEKKNDVEYTQNYMTLPSISCAQFVLQEIIKEKVPVRSMSTVHNNTVETNVILKLVNFKTLYHEGLSPFIFDSS